MLFENLWAIKFIQAVLDANGRVVMQERIPSEIVSEAVKELSTVDLKSSAKGATTS